jgi:phosphoadenosine phosphosulfate reductase
MRLVRKDLETVNGELERLTPLAFLRWAHTTFGKRAAILSSMQRAGSVLCHMADRAGLDFDVLFVDTGVLHRETLETRDALARTHGKLRVRTLSPERSFADQTRHEGVLYLSKEGQERCCDLRKNAPLRSVRGQYDALLGALRRGEGGARSEISPLSLDVELNLLRVHPFVSFGKEDLEKYVESHRDVVINPLHSMGFPTIGCFPCTTPVREDEPERAGRWRHLAGVEYCGINPSDRSDAAEGGIEIDDRYALALALT